MKIWKHSYLDVVMLAPKGPGTALRSLYQQGKGMIGLWAVEQDSTGNARAIAGPITDST